MKPLGTLGRHVVATESDAVAQPFTAGSTVVLILLLALLISAPITPAAAAGYPRSQSVALVPDAGGRFNHGGTLPTTGFLNYAPSFTNISPEAIRDSTDDPLASGFDTVVLNSICDIAAFLSDSDFKSRIEDFVRHGGKLIIWDSECQNTDYNDFALPFSTNNPGQAGAQGTLSDIEDNTLSSTNAASPSYIDVAAISTGTDAVGDANVFTTFDPGWFIDLRAVNINGVDGPVQAYANLGSGLILYSGLDKDNMGDFAGFDPLSPSGATHLNRVWLLELLQPWDPDGLPHENPVVGGRYVAIGDSFSSGEGNPPFVTGTATDGTNECHRSHDAYGPMLASTLFTSPFGSGVVLDSQFTFGACSGAIMAEITETLSGTPGQWNEGPQLDAIAPFSAPSNETTLVTLSIGGNDAGFADGLGSCIRGSFKNQVFHGDCRVTVNQLAASGIELVKNGGTIQIDKTSATWRFCGPSGGGACVPWRGGDRFVSASIADLAGVLGKIRDRAPSAHIVVLLYPRLFSPVPAGKCVVGQRTALAGNTQSYTLDHDAMVAINAQTDALDNAIRAEVNQAKGAGIDVDYADPRPSFVGHGVRCIGDPGATTTPWINRLLFDTDSLSDHVVLPYSFHPNKSGQAQFKAIVEGAL